LVRTPIVTCFTWFNLVTFNFLLINWLFLIIVRFWKYPMGLQKST
jgi:hypothetical protein